MYSSFLAKAQVDKTISRLCNIMEYYSSIVYFASKFKYAFSQPAFFKFVSSNGIVARAVHFKRAKKSLEHCLAVE